MYSSLCFVAALLPSGSFSHGVQSVSVDFSSSVCITHPPLSFPKRCRNYNNGSPGAPTTPPTSRIHYNLVIRKFSSIHKKTKWKILLKQKEKYQFSSANTQSVWSPHSGPLLCSAPPSSTKRIIRDTPTSFSHTLCLPPVFASQFSIILTFYIKEPTFSLHVTYSLHTSSHFKKSLQACSHEANTQSLEHRKLPSVPTVSISYACRESVLSCQVFWRNDLDA